MQRLDPNSLNRYFKIAEGGVARGNHRFYMKFLFEGIDFSGKTMLDIGGGDGMLSFYAACSGAEKVICLEPQAAGSAAGTNAAFERIASLLGDTNVQLLPTRLQDYDAGNGSFDILLLHASINHLDEDACIGLHCNREAQRSYQQLFHKLSSLARPSAKLIVVDCARRNLFGDLHLNNPFQPTIEWHKHQSPKLWARHLAQAGFNNRTTRWHSFNTFRSLGRLVLGNRIAAYCLTSSFCLTMEKRR
jgi:cyclopropane fatty-acyl-phospholipid synthase-like methyltransferase